MRILLYHTQTLAVWKELMGSLSYITGIKLNGAKEPARSQLLLYSYSWRTSIWFRSDNSSHKRTRYKSLCPFQWLKISGLLRNGSDLVSNRRKMECNHTSWWICRFERTSSGFNKQMSKMCKHAAFMEHSIICRQVHADQSSALASVSGYAEAIWPNMGRWW